MRRGRESRQQVDIWPGFVDALSTLLLSVIFLLVVFVLGQFFLTQVLQTRNQAVGRLQGQVDDLSQRLGLEQDSAAELRRTLGRLNGDLQQAFAARDEASERLSRAEGERDQIGASLSALTDQQQQLRGQIGALTGERDGALAARDAAQQALTAAQQGAGADQARARAEVQALTAQIAQLGDQLRQVNAALGLKQQETDQQNAQIADLGRRLNVALAERVEELNRYRSDFFGRLRQALGSREDVRIVGDRFVFQSDVLFASGAADLNPAGLSQLGALAATLREVTRGIPGDLPWVIQVDGHTDRRPISTPRYPSNWELSAARAISVAQYLIAQGISPDRVAARGFAEFQPLDPADNEDAYRRNRRIEIKLTTR